MYVRERSRSLRASETGQDDVRTRKRGESSSGEGESGSGERVEVRRGARGSSMRRQQQVVEAPSFLTRAAGSVIKLVRVAEFEILFVSFFVLAVLLFKDLTARPEYNQILVQRRFEEKTRLY